MIIALLFTIAVFAHSQTLVSGKITTFPLDLGVRYYATVGGVAEWCDAVNTSEISCTATTPPFSVLHHFHAAIASQGIHEFLIGCLSSDFQRNNWNCANLSAGAYDVSVHNQTVIVLGDGFGEINTETGKVIRSITPVFSILTVQK
jgi:hypothetical protein